MRNALTARTLAGLRQELDMSLPDTVMRPLQFVSTNKKQPSFFFVTREEGGWNSTLDLVYISSLICLGRNSVTQWGTITYGNKNCKFSIGACLTRWVSQKWYGPMYLPTRLCPREMKINKRETTTKNTTHAHTWVSPSSGTEREVGKPCPGRVAVVGYHLTMTTRSQYYYCWVSLLCAADVQLGNNSSLDTKLAKIKYKHNISCSK